MTMRKASVPSTGKSKSNGDNYALPQFVSCELSAEQKTWLKSHLPPIQELLDDLDGWIRDGYKISFRFDERSNAVQATLTGPQQDSPNSGLALSSRGPSLHASLGVLAYKHLEVLKEDWSGAVSPGAPKDTWG